MSWDWKKANGVGDTAAGSILTKSFGATQPAAKRVAPPSSGQGRSPIISWRSAGVTNLTGFGSAIAVVLLVISLVPIIIFLSWSMREDSQI